MRRKKAVALAYRPGLPAPFVAARGKGAAAERIEALAESAGVPVLRNDALAEALVPLDPGAYVPEPYWELVARVFVTIAEMEGRARRGSLT